MSPKAPTFGEDAFQSLRPGHGRAAFGRRLVLRLIEGLGLAAFTTLGGRHQRTMFTVGTVRRSGKHPVETGEVDSRLRHQRRQFCNEVQGLENDMSERRPVVPSL